MAISETDQLLSNNIINDSWAYLLVIVIIIIMPICDLLYSTVSFIVTLEPTKNKAKFRPLWGRE